MSHFAIPYFFVPNPFIVVFCLHLRFSICFALRGAKKRNNNNSAGKIDAVTFAARFIHLRKKEI